MQYKILVPALLTLICSGQLRAQQSHSLLSTHHIKVIEEKPDTVNPKPVAKTIIPASESAAASPAPVAALIAANLPSERPAEYKKPSETKVADKIAELPKAAEKKAADKENKPADNRKAGYKTVPLAGEKSYFGEKNEYVNDFVRKYLELHNKTLGSVQNASSKPFSVIDDVLEQKQLPKELKYLAVIESALNHNAVSHAGAVGPWQLMAPTARMMGLSVNRKHDDRRDWYKSTTAATKYLELLYSQLNDWLLVIAAYNSGPTPVQKAIERTGSHNFWDIKQYLPHETQGHVLAFIATASIFENLSKFIDLGSIPVDFKFGKEEDPLPSFKKDIAGKTVTAPGISGNTASSTIVTGANATAVPASAANNVVIKKSPYTEEELKHMTIVRIKEPISLELMAQELNIDKKVLNRWNPDYDMFVLKTYPTPFYNLRLPKDKQDAFIAKKDMMTQKSKSILD